MNPLEPGDLYRIHYPYGGGEPPLLAYRLFSYTRTLTEPEREGQLVFWSWRNEHEQLVRLPKTDLMRLDPVAEARARHIIAMTKQGLSFKALRKAGAAYEQALWDLKLAVHMLDGLRGDEMPLLNFASGANLYEAVREKGGDVHKEALVSLFQKALDASKALTSIERKILYT